MNSTHLLFGIPGIEFYKPSLSFLPKALSCVFPCPFIFCPMPAADSRDAACHENGGECRRPEHPSARQNVQDPSSRRRMLVWRRGVHRLGGYTESAAALKSGRQRLLTLFRRRQEAQWYTGCRPTRSQPGRSRSCEAPRTPRQLPGYSGIPTLRHREV